MGVDAVESGHGYLVRGLCPAFARSTIYRQTRVQFSPSALLHAKRTAPALPRT